MAYTAFGPKGRLLVSGSTDGNVRIHDGTIRIWDALRGVLLRAIDAHEGKVWSLAWDPEGGLLASDEPLVAQEGEGGSAP